MHCAKCGKPESHKIHESRHKYVECDKTTCHPFAPKLACAHKYPAACGCYTDLPCTDCGDTGAPIDTTTNNLYSIKHVFWKCWPESDGDLVCLDCAIARVERLADAAVSDKDAKNEERRKR